MIFEVTDLNLPVIYLSIAVIAGCYSCLCFTAEYILGAVVTASFLFIIFLTTEKPFTQLIIIFYIIGITSYGLYFHVESNYKVMKVRIMSTSFNSVTAKYKERLYELQGDIHGLTVGELATVKGNFKNCPDFERGIVGKFTVQNYIVDKNDFFYKLKILKVKFYNKLKNELGEFNSGEIMALCFGDTEYLTQAQKELYKKLGIIHAISVSGFHLAIIFQLLEGIVGIYPALLISLIYVIFTGSAPATVRAFVMIFILKLSPKLFKSYNGLNSLAFTAALMLLIKPYYISNVGFVLSCLATLGIMLFYNRLQRILCFLPASLNSTVSVCISAQIFAGPYGVLCFSTFSVGFIPANIILLPLYSAAVLIGNFALIVSFIAPIFKAVCLCLNLLMISISGATFLLLKITPEICYYYYYDCVFVLSLLLCYILYRNGIYKIKYVPLIIFTTVFLQYYSVVPKLFIVKQGNQIFEVYRYKWNSVLISNTNNKLALKQIKSKYYNNKTIILLNEGELFNLDKSYSFIHYSDKLKLQNKNNCYIISYSANAMPCYIKEDSNCVIINETNLEKYSYTFYILFNKIYLTKLG